MNEYTLATRPRRDPLPWAEIITFTAAITIACALGTCIGVTGAFAIDRALHPELYVTE